MIKYLKDYGAQFHYGVTATKVEFDITADKEELLLCV